MAWGPNPIDAAAAAQAEAEARERLANKPLSPFERQLILTLEEIRDQLVNQRVPAPVGTFKSGVISSRPGALANLLDAEPGELDLAIDAGATALGNAIAAATKPLNTREDLERLAETVIDAALRQAAQLTEAGKGDEADLLLDEVDRPKRAAAGGDSSPPPPAAAVHETTAGTSGPAT